MDNRSLNIPDPQILLHYFHDAGGFYHHHRVLLFRVSQGTWVLLSPDLELEVVDLTTRRHRIGGRHAPLPDDIADECYIFDELPKAELERQRRLAKTMGAILGDAESVDVESIGWYGADPSSKKFGEALPNDLVGDIVALGQHGVVQWDDNFEFVREMGSSEVEKFREEKKDSLGDARLLGDHRDAQGKRHMTLQDALTLMSQEKFDDWSFSGPRATKEYLTSIRDGPGDLLSYHTGWVRASGVAPNSAISHEHKNLIETLRLGFSKDQLDLSNLCSFENICRRLVVLEIAASRNPSAPDFTGLDVVTEAPISQHGQAQVSTVTSWVTERLKERAQIQKQSRLFKEEFGKTKKAGYGEEEDQTGTKNKWRRKKKQDKDAGGAAGSAGASMDQFQDRRRHGDPFPLNLDEVTGRAVDGGVFEPQRARWIGDSLNRLALRDMNSFSSPILLSARQPTVVQDFVMDRIVDSLLLHGDKPVDVTAESALADLQAAEISYDGTPNNLANYDPGKLKVLRSRVQPKRITKFLPPEPAKLVEHYESQIISPEHENHDSFSPYWDPQLRFDKAKRLDFILRLHRSGLVSLRKSPKSFIGAFFVKKKTPDAIRMVLDCRGTNQLHQPPPTTRLGSARGYADLDLSDEPLESGWGIEADVNDAFYNFSIPELTHYFAFNHPMTASEWTKVGINGDSVYDPQLRQMTPTDPDEILFPCVEAVPMGWSWALFLCNEAVLNICRSNAPWVDGIFREKKVAPQMRDFKTSIGVYVDNITVIGRSKDDVELRAQSIAEAFRAADIPITWTQHEPVKSLESVGCALDFERKTLHNKPKRIWKFHLATRAILRRDKVKGKLLQIWAGHFTSLCALTPWGLSCLQDLYRFIEVAKVKRMKLWPSVRREIKVASAVVWMTWRDLAAPFSKVVEVDDSSSSGYALVSCEPGVERIRTATKVHEKWRFIAMPECLKAAAVSCDSKAFEEKLLELLGPVASDKKELAKPVTSAGLTTEYGRMVLDSMQEGSWLRISKDGTGANVQVLVQQNRSIF
ncbi:Uncharacterized protein SCF082_LOCUS1918 [Durusdinium trenchii]|uniref:Reverse transcriptase domain-containing protein n=1 Tax=Durusdinium trenchii TaxID=1381693 RepID=A0ABP0HHJ5_9DINO